MSCRTTAGGSVSTSLAKAVTGLKDDEIQHLFHALKREGTGMDAPSELRIAAWRSRQYDLVSRMKRMSILSSEIGIVVRLHATAPLPLPR